MYYVIFDLEWNNAYSHSRHGIVNEILEIGAVMVDEGLSLVDRFSQVVRSQLSRKVSGRIKRITHISNEEMNSGIGFADALEAFDDWVGGRDCLFMTWGETDIRVLIDNYKMFLATSRIPFMGMYCDLQRYCQERISAPKHQQIGLNAAAEQLGVDIDDDTHLHRALDDCVVSLNCLKRCYDRDALLRRAHICDQSFYEKLKFKAHYTTDRSDPRVDPDRVRFTCSDCMRQMERVSDWRCANRSFRAVFSCAHCDGLEICTVKFKDLYDEIEVRRSQKKIVPKSEV